MVLLCVCLRDSADFHNFQGLKFVQLDVFVVVLVMKELVAQELLLPHCKDPLKNHSLLTPFSRVYKHSQLTGQLSPKINELKELRVMYQEILGSTFTV